MGTFGDIGDIGDIFSSWGHFLKIFEKKEDPLTIFEMGGSLLSNKGVLGPSWGI